MNTVSVALRMTSSSAPFCSSCAAAVSVEIGCTNSATPSRASSVSMSMARSTTMVASSIVFDSPSRRASAHGRTNSPSRSGSTMFAMNPIMVELNRLSPEMRRGAAISSRQRIALTQKPKMVSAMVPTNPR